ncbi:white collar 2 type of transcription factor [Lecanicillium sp. MT-2017a]|nr:white collar 2 type of transcription factor [Lecanicillium sp. MT-2017a]
MSQGAQPPRQSYVNLPGFGNVEIDSFPDASAQDVAMASAPAQGSHGASGAGFQGNDPDQDDAMMSFFYQNALSEFGSGMAMNVDSNDGSLPQNFNADSIVNDIIAENSTNAGPSDMPGGGPPPIGEPPQPTGNAQLNAGASTVNEFTKRRNWPAKVVEELQDFLQILDADGRIKFASNSVQEVSGYTPDEIRSVFLKDLIHPDDQGVFVSELNESIASGNPLHVFYRFKKRDGVYAIFEAVGHAHIASAKFAPNPNNQSPFCQAVFIMSRPYPTKNASLLDSFLEHKIENERLKRRIAELRHEEELADNDTLRQSSAAMSASGVTPSNATPSDVAGADSTPYFQRSTDAYSSADSDVHMANGALTRENLEGASGGGRRDSLVDKMARYEGSAPHEDTIEMLTGLRYVEGERSRGITTGNTSPALIKGDAGIAIPKDRDGRQGDKKKKLKVSEEYVCTDCGTLDSPEWRKGPKGPKTLCNACGLRWAKKEKKRGKPSDGLQSMPSDFSMSGA